MSAMLLLPPMAGMTKMADKGLLLGEERSVGKIEMLKRGRGKRAPWIGKLG